MEEIKTFQRINFIKNWNNKLLNLCFSTIRPVSDSYIIGERFDIRIDERFYCYADLIDKVELSLQEIINQKYHLLDSGLSEKDFYSMMEGFYSKKKWWKEKETKMQLLFLKKFVQIDIFDVIENKI